MLIDNSLASRTYIIVDNLVVSATIYITVGNVRFTHLDFEVSRVPRKSRRLMFGTFHCIAAVGRSLRGSLCHPHHS